MSLTYRFVGVAVVIINCVHIVNCKRNFEFNALMFLMEISVDFLRLGDLITIDKVIETHIIVIR